MIYCIILTFGSWNNKSRKAALHMTGLGCVTYLHAPVTAQGDDVVAEDGVLVSVELSSGHLGGCRHTGGVRDTLKQQQTKRGGKIRMAERQATRPAYRATECVFSEDFGY